MFHTSSLYSILPDLPESTFIHAYTVWDSLGGNIPTYNIIQSVSFNPNFTEYTSHLSLHIPVKFASYQTLLLSILIITNFVCYTHICNKLVYPIYVFLLIYFS